ncbi:hypothetical protein TTHERM_000470561 (macronuclear) [Tetrahymena thermophila SB210]|uniref:Uncharacterized protein n=1 Tax=Tetrahymena thermophila (strain SB210) TaxID=312017 RepID=W7X287_TETTS|nr:hypothetical protein TTHERM_000470561 [Tetrahymena thermophila SB210]EWS73300.1 hypothetical protein TTHERM_000470561 [Tetrahymena thermophila SB210]|eukprot:XP_012654149.1 hypothetical protein TTHERM_000470561 [Tetrahymena thermophila SB210]
MISKYRYLHCARKLVKQSVQAFGGGHHHHEYDWRDDPKVNKDIEEDIRDRGWHPETYDFPYTKKHDDWVFDVTMPSQNYQTDLTVNIHPENKKMHVMKQVMRQSYWDAEHDMAHEYDYESEDLDFQCESFKSQHFRKKGPISQYLILGLLPILYFGTEFFYNHYPDEDYWRVAHPPPLDYPDTDDTDDTETFKDYKSFTGRRMVDTGIVDPLWYDIREGKKVYYDWAGVNQPMEDI